MKQGLQTQKESPFCEPFPRVHGLAGVMTPQALSCRIQRFIDTQCQEFSGEKDFTSLSKEESRRSEQSTLTSGVLMWLVGGEVEAQPVGL